jgi:starvation-inducible DNA-binding protein
VPRCTARLLENDMTQTQLNGKSLNTLAAANSGMTSTQREQMITLLNTHLACTSDLLSQTKQAHWNVRGPHFMSLHLLFDQLAEGLEGYVDVIAERAAALGGYVNGTVRMAAAQSKIEEYPSGHMQDIGLVAALAARYAVLGGMVREASHAAVKANDADTADLFTEVSRDLDKWLWFLQSHTQE